MKTNYAVIGCGRRLRGLVALLANHDEVVLRGAWDPDSSNCEMLCRVGDRNTNTARVFDSYQAILEDREVDWVLIGSPNVFHAEHIMAAFSAGKNVFTEKPLATTIPDCLATLKAAQLCGKAFATGFTLRYSNLYRKVKELLSAGTIGTIVSIDANENISPDHGAYIMTNWRRFHEQAGSHILEKCVHDLDLLNWLADSVPVRVAAFGGNNMFIPRNAPLMDQTSVFRGEIGSWSDISETGLDPFTTEKTIEDNIVAILEFANGVRAQFQATTSNAIPERRMYFSGTEGTLIVDLYKGSLEYQTIHDRARQVVEIDDRDLHGGGDSNMIAELVDSMVSGTAPVCSGQEGLRSAVVGIAIDEARREGAVIQLEQTWKALEV